LTEYKIIRKLMGSVFELIVIANNGPEANHFFEAGINEINRLEDLLSEFKDTSEISAINRNAGIKPITVSKEVYRLLARCKQLYKITQGAFDITIGPLKRLYNFRNQQFDFPSRYTIKKTLLKIGSDKIELNGNNTVYLTLKGMSISLAAIGKGYAADCVKKIWTDMKVKAGVINASGDLTVIGEKEENKPWVAGIPDPDHKEKILFYIPLKNMAIATSGDYEQFFIKDGIRYSHALDPKNGLPLKGIKSVSVVTSSGELCDALATAVYVMGTKAGLHFIDQVPHAYALIINGNNEVFASKNLEFLKS
jgi:FAD:protein FMN transferase